MTGVALLIAMGGLVVVQNLPFIVAIGLVFAFICVVGWSLEPFEA